MAYLVYETSNNDTLESIAKYYNISSTTLATINNIQMPYNSLAILTPGTKIKVPELRNGRESVENSRKKDYITLRNFKSSNDWKFDYNVSDPVSGFNTDIGFASQGKCYLAISGHGVIYFPCYPESYSDSHQASVTPQTPLGRSEPFQIYQNSGPRSVSVNFRMDREMNHWTPIGSIVAAVQACCYPIGTTLTIIPRVTLVIGNNCSITGLITNVSTNWSDTIIEDRYMITSLDFSVTECTGNPKTFDVVASLGGV